MLPRLGLPLDSVPLFLTPQAQEAIRGADQKASLIAVIGSALVAFRDQDAALTPLTVAALMALLAAVVCAGAVIVPRLSRRRARQQSCSKRDGVYWGELRHWPASDLAAHLKQQAIDRHVYLEALGRQLVAIARIADVKHRWLRAALAAALVAAVLQVPAFLLR
jgi:hypothetical protein